MGNKDTIMIAHVKQNPDDTWVVHPLEEHLRDVGRIAGEMAE